MREASKKKLLVIIPQYSAPYCTIIKRKIKDFSFFVYSNKAIAANNSQTINGDKQFLLFVCLFAPTDSAYGYYTFRLVAL